MTATPRTEDETRYAALVGRNLRLRRRALGLTAQDLVDHLRAKGMAISAPSITKIERCQANVRQRVGVTVDQLIAFAEVLGCHPMQLLTEPECSACNGAPPIGFTCNQCQASQTPRA